MWLLTEQMLKREAVPVLEGVSAASGGQLPPSFFDAAVLDPEDAGQLEVRVNSRRRLSAALGAMGKG